MRTLICFFLTLGSAFSATTVTGTLLRGDLSPLPCRINIYPSTTFVTPASKVVLKGTIVTVTNNPATGVFSVSLEPNDTATPTNTYYTASYSCAGKLEQTWTVPTSGSPVNVTAIASNSVPGPTPLIPLTQLSPGGATEDQCLIYNGTAWLPGTCTAGAGTIASTSSILKGDGAGNAVAGAAADLPAHASRHQHSGNDEIATATAGANLIPKSDSGGKLAAGWIPALSDLSGAVTDAQVPNTITLDNLTQITTRAYSSLSGLPTLAQTATATGGQCLNAYDSTTGAFTKATCSGGGGGPAECITSGTSTAYTCTAGITPAEGSQVKIKLNVTSGASPTLDVDATGAIGIFRRSGTAVGAGFMVAGTWYTLTYSDGTPDVWVLTEPDIVAGASGGVQIVNGVADTTNLVPIKTSAWSHLGAFSLAGASSSAPFRIGSSDPATCDATDREWFYNTTTSELKVCNATNTWTKYGLTGTPSGNTTEFGTITGTKTTGKQLEFDASGNVKASTSDIGGGASFETPLFSDGGDIFEGTGSAQDLYSYAMPGNTLQVGDVLHIQVYGARSDASGTPVDGTDEYLMVGTGATDNPTFKTAHKGFRIDLYYTVTGTTTQRISGTLAIALAVQAAWDDDTYFNDTAFDITGSVTVRLRMPASFVATEYMRIDKFVVTRLRYSV